MVVVNIIAFILVLIGCFNWGLVGIFNWNLVGAITGGGYNVFSAIIYILVFLAALWLIYACIMGRGKIQLDYRNYKPTDEDKVR